MTTFHLSITVTHEADEAAVEKWLMQTIQELPDVVSVSCIPVLAALEALREEAKSMRECKDSGQCFHRSTGIDFACDKIEEAIE